MKKLFIAAAVIVMAGSMASCGQKTQKAAQDTAATEPVATEQVEAVEVENRNAGIRDSCRCRESENTTGAGK